MATMIEGTACSHCGKIYGHEDWCPRNGVRMPADAKVVAASALDTQVAGGHYKHRAIQPVEYIHANGLGFLEGCIVKRITRWRDKPATDRFEDLRKIKHEVDLLIELETKRAAR